MSNSDLMLDVDQAGELKAAFRRGKWTNAEIKRLSEGNILMRVRNVLLGYAEIKPIPHVIDCDADPVIPKEWKNGWSVEEHRKGGPLEWNHEAQAKALYWSKCQEGGRIISGNDLRKELEGQPVLNANVLDYLLKHPRLIPKDRKGKNVFFWGTIYRGPGGDLGVRFLCWGGGKWYWHWHRLEHDWNYNDPAALRASFSV